MYCNVSPRVSVYGRVQSSQESTSSVRSRATPPKCFFQRSCGTAGLSVFSSTSVIVSTGLRSSADTYVCVYIYIVKEMVYGSRNE